jgi:hypothetical protein
MSLRTPPHHEADEEKKGAAFEPAVAEDGFGEAAGSVDKDIGILEPGRAKYQMAHGEYKYPKQVAKSVLQCRIVRSQSPPTRDPADLAIVAESTYRRTRKVRRRNL